MKNFKTYLAYLAVFALFFSSCSKDENQADLTGEKASLSFGAIVNDIANSMKQTDIADLPECTGDDPAFVEIVLMQGDEFIVGEVEPFRIDLVDGQVFTEDVPELELTAGDYTLTHFSVHNSAGDLIWLAPRSGGTLASFVQDALPMTITLGAGVKKYVDVPVLCFDDRNVIEYGYQFFEFDMTEAFEFCFFVNYCAPRHFPARYSVEISIEGTVIYTQTNTVNDEGEDPFAVPLCFALPDLPQYEDDEEYIDYTITLLDWEGVYDAPDMEPITGSLSRDEITANFVGENEVEYEHFKFGCGNDPNPGGDDDEDDDGVPNEDDQCPGFDDKADMDDDGIPDGCDECDEVATGNDDDGDCQPNNEDPCPNDPENECDEEPGGGDEGDVLEGCETAYMVGNRTFMDNDGDNLNIGRNWGWAQEADIDPNGGSFTAKLRAGGGQNDPDKGYWIGNVTVTMNNGEAEVDIEVFDGNQLNKVDIYFSNTKPVKHSPGQYGNKFFPAEDGLSYDDFSDADGEFWIIVHADACPEGQGEGEED